VAVGGTQQSASQVGSTLSIDASRASRTASTWSTKAPARTEKPTRGAHTRTIASSMPQAAQHPYVDFLASFSDPM
jgi:hypothetical protein